MSVPVKMTPEEFEEHCSDDNGLCLACGSIRFGDTEPDAEEYPCEECGENQVQGMENCLIDGNVVLEEE